MEEDKIFKTKPPLIYFILFSMLEICFPILPIIPFIEMKFERIDYHIVLGEIFFFIIYLIINWSKQYELTYTGKNVILTKIIFFKTEVTIPVNLIKRIKLTMSDIGRIKSYKLLIELENQKKEYKFFELNKKSIMNISKIKISDLKKSSTELISEKKIISAGTFVNFYCIACIIFSVILALRNIIKQ